MFMCMLLFVCLCVESRESSAGLDSHQDRLAEVHRMRERIEGMRTTVADHFAAEVAKSCNIQ